VLPASFGVAILRYRLYDLDLLANRTVVYGLVTVILALAFGAADLVGQRLLETLVGQHSDLLSGALGVAAALTFGPVRQRIRPVVDRFLPARGRLTMLFTDIVGSTQTIVEVGDERWREILDGYRSTVRTSLSRFRGREEDTAGDAFFATFDHPGAAMACAREIRGAVKGLGLTLRTGLHVGQVEMRGEKVSGLTVHAAARIMAEAGGDQILVSEDLAEALRDGMPGALPDGIPFVDAGRHTLKGVPGEWQLFALAPAD
jgi:class 3 adenylate cyclase